MTTRNGRPATTVCHSKPVGPFRGVVFPWDQPAEEESSKALVAEEAELQRYQNRAALSQRVLRDKISEGDLLRKKLRLLQDVVIQRRQASVKEATMHNRTVGELQAAQQNLQQELQQMQVLAQEWNQSSVILEVPTQKARAQVEELREVREREKEEWSRRSRTQEDQAEEYQSWIRALQQEVLDGDQSLESTQQDMINLQKQDKIEREKKRVDMLQERQKSARLEKELQTLQVQTQIALQQLQNQTDALHESTAIATAAVSAAERREATMGLQWQDLQSNFTQLQDENNSLKQQLAGSPSTPVGSNDAAIREQEKFRQEIDGLQEQLRSLRSKNSAEQRMNQKKAQEELDNLRAEYELKLDILRQRQRRPSGDPPPTSSTKRLWQRLRRPFQRRR